MAMQISAETLLKILNTLPLLASDVAAGIRSLIESRGFDVDKLLSAGAVLNEQNLTHINAEIARVEAALKSKGGDPQTIVVPPSVPTTKATSDKSPATTKKST